jgi:hypothetical protein
MNLGDFDFFLLAQGYSRATRVNYCAFVQRILKTGGGADAWKLAQYAESLAPASRRQARGAWKLYRESQPGGGPLPEWPDDTQIVNVTAEGRESVEVHLPVLRALFEFSRHMGVLNDLGQLLELRKASIVDIGAGPSIVLDRQNPYDHYRLDPAGYRAWREFVRAADPTDTKPKDAPLVTVSRETLLAGFQELSNARRSA